MKGSLFFLFGFVLFSLCVDGQIPVHRESSFRRWEYITNLDQAQGVTIFERTFFKGYKSRQLLVGNSKGERRFIMDPNTISRKVKGANYGGFFVFEGRLYTVSVQKAKKKEPRKIYVTEVDLTNGRFIGEPKEVGVLKGESKQWKFKIKVSANQKYIALVPRWAVSNMLEMVLDERMEWCKFFKQAIVLDQQLNPVTNFDYYNERSEGVRPKRFELDNNGNLYFLEYSPVYAMDDLRVNKEHKIAVNKVKKGSKVTETHWIEIEYDKPLGAVSFGMQGEQIYVASLRKHKSESSNALVHVVGIDSKTMEKVKEYEADVNVQFPKREGKPYHFRMQGVRLTDQQVYVVVDQYAEELRTSTYKSNATGVTLHGGTEMAHIGHSYILELDQGLTAHQEYEIKRKFRTERDKGMYTLGNSFVLNGQFIVLQPVNATYQDVPKTRMKKNYILNCYSIQAGELKAQTLIEGKSNDNFMLLQQTRLTSTGKLALTGKGYGQGGIYAFLE